jgi:hypothetical protein
MLVSHSQLMKWIKKEKEKPSLVISSFVLALASVVSI